MQTRTLGLRALSLAFVSVMTLGLAACEETKTVVPEDPTVLTISPTGTVDLQVGDRITVAANVTNAAASGATVTWASSNTAVATVDANGTVTAVAPGITTVTASVAARDGTTLRQALAVRVTPRAGGGPDTSRAAISIVSVVDNNNNPVPATNVTGQVNVRVDYTRGSATKVQVMVNNTVACEQTFGTSAKLPAGAVANAAQVDFVCPINTARVDSTGAVTFPNGPATITARLLGPTGTVLASATTSQLTFANPNQIALTVTPARTGVDAAGLLWAGGDVTVRAAPAIFTSGVTATSVTVTATNANTGAVVATRTATAAPFTVTFRESTELNGIATDNLQFTATSIAGGTTGPTTTAATRLRYDDVNPTIVAAAAVPAWINGAFAFNATGTGAEVTATDVHSNNVTVTFHAAPFASVSGTTTDSAIVANNAAITTGSQLAQTNTTNGYVVVARVMDAVGNVSYLRISSAVGVDLEAPTTGFATGSVENNAINPSGNYIINFTDAVSGPAANAFQVQGILVNRSGTSCIDLTTGTVTAVPTTTGVCPFVSTSNGTIAIPESTDGYVTANIRVIDQAGNTSALLTRTYLDDDAAPTVSISSTTIAGSDVSVSGTIRDNVDIDMYDTRQMFGAVATLPFAMGTDVSAFGAPLDTVRTATTTATVFRGIQTADASGNPTTITNISGAGFGAWDLAMNFTFGGSVVSGITSDGIVDEGVDNWRLTNTATTICGTGSTTSCGSGSSATPATRTLTAVARNTTSPSTFDKPFSTVYFYRTDASGNAWLIGSTTAATLNTTATERTYTYSFDWNAAGMAAGSTNVFAVGVTAERDLGQTAPVAFTIQ